MAPRALVILFIGVFAGIVGVVGLAMVALVGLVGLDPTPPLGGPPSGLVPGRIPAAYLRDYRAAAATCPGLPWSVLAAIGEVETAQGRDDHPSTAGAVGPMQFLPATFAAYDEPVPPGGADPPSPYDPADAIYAAARMLCTNGARDGRDIPGAIYAYNHSLRYVIEVLADADVYAHDA
ncbi:MAG: lytic transglycosylase domain-containing protein [Acidimicrobiales bacterium]